MANRSKKRHLKRRRRPGTTDLANVAPTSNSETRIQQALQLQKVGDLQQAKQVYCQILAVDPLNPDAWHLLGMTLHAAGQHNDALECLQKASEIVPHHPEVLANLGVVLRSVGCHNEARFALEHSVALDPHSPMARNNLGTVLLELSELDAAEQEFEAALKIAPGFANAKMNLANVWQKQGRMRDAEQSYRQLLKQTPNDSLVLTNLGETLRKQCKWNEAASVLGAALQLNPALVETDINLGRALQHGCRHEEAKEHFLGLADRHPDIAKAHHYLGKSLFDLGEMTAAADRIAHSLELDPTDPYALRSLGFVFLEMGQRDKAAECFQEVIDRDPTMSEAHGSLLFIMSGDPTMTQQTLFNEHVRWGTMHGNVAPLGNHSVTKDQNRRLRIGYVSPDLRSHVVASYFQPVLHSHDSAEVETFCYAEVARPDKTTEQLKRLADHWRATNGYSDLQVAQQIADDKIDILVDLAGHTAGNRLIAFAHRPAPIQMTWLGYPNTTGLPAVDYRLTCETQDPLNQPSYHVEQLIRMQGGSFCFSAPAHAPDVKPPPALSNGYITLGSLHRPFKISDPVRDLWARVLLACPKSRMLIFNTRFTDESTTDLRQSLVQRGVDADRLEIRNSHNGETYFEMYHKIDIALDVFPWAGGTTTLEALWMGVPVLAFYGDRRGARSTATIVGNVGNPGWIADSFDQYVALAEAFSADVEQLTQMRRGLRDRVRETVANGERFTRELEKTYRDVWTRWCQSTA